ncbi:MAG: hypothetical protein LBJ69_02985 [Holosporales bacterium]|jgi:apolipoprotein N-acyltransferase|nr:hypothetical protein [Holosporales bacterium]
MRYPVDYGVHFSGGDLSGISCIIDCNGSIVSKLETDVVGVLDAYMPLPYRNTFFGIDN